MEQSPNHQKQLIKSHFLKNITKLLLSVSVFSLFFSHSSWLSFNLYAFLSHNLDKNYIFLLFNGLVVYLAKTSGLISSASKHSHFNKAHDHYHYHYHYLDGLKPEPLLPEAEAPFLEKYVIDETNESHQEVVVQIMTSDECVIQEALEKETKKLIVEKEKGVEEEEAEEENGSMSTEELNKKFDDFIRKMKKELRIEAQQQQLIMV